jgi:hypothetical protein
MVAILQPARGLPVCVKDHARNFVIEIVRAIAHLPRIDNKRYAMPCNSN